MRPRASYEVGYQPALVNVGCRLLEQRYSTAGIVSFFGAELSRYLPQTLECFEHLSHLPAQQTKVKIVNPAQTDDSKIAELNFLGDLDFSPKMIGQQIAKVLMAAIIANDVKGGEKLLENQIEKKFGVSRSPVREAIRELEKMRLVEIVPRRGAFVKKITKKDIKEDMEVRGRLEGIAAREAYARKDDQLIAKLESAMKLMREAASRGDNQEFWQSHRLFHEAFILASSHDLLMYILPILRIHSERARNVFPVPDENLEERLQVHQTILDKFKSENTSAAEIESCVCAHIVDYLPNYLQSITSIEPAEQGPTE